MSGAGEAFDEVLAWRASGGRIRFGQAAFVAALASIAIGVLPAIIWISATVLTATLDGLVCRASLARPDDRRLRILAYVTMAMAASAFTAVAVLLMAQRTHAALAETALILCAVNINNAIMTRASRLGSALIMAPSAALLVAMPWAAIGLGHRLTAPDCILLETGAVTFLIFTGRLAAMLHNEAWTIRRALEDQERQRRRAEFAMDEAVQSRALWRTLFDQSPLPQSYFSATRLHALLRPLIAGREAPLGDLVRELVGDVAEGLSYIDRLEGNEAVEALFGAIGDRSRFADPGRFQDGFLEGFCAGLNGMNEDGVLAPFDTQIVRPSGELLDVRVHVRMPPGQEPPWSMCMISYVDITEQLRAARAQAAAVEAAEAANRAKSEFLAMMSHEIRTPLNGVLGMAQAMERDALSQTQRVRLDIIRQSGAGLLDIVNDVLDLSKIEAGKLDLEIADFDLEALARGVQAAFGPLAARKGLDLDVEVTPDACGFWRGDAARVRQVVYNLVGNAVKFTETGSVKVDIATGPAGVSIAVRDTGIGIDRERAPRLFERFVQADSTTTRRFGGTGLGLAICLELCKAMGGTIDVESEPGVGSTFCVRLPLPRGEAAPIPAAPAPTLAPSPQLKVLAAEDNAVNQLVLKTLLAQVGIEPVMVSNGAEAVAAFDQGPWDLILMDVQMPQMDGPSAARAIRAREAQTGAEPTPIIALTANAMSHQLDAYWQAGMSGVLAKPIEVAKLYETLAAASPQARVPARGAA